MADLLPDAVLHRKDKMGFPVPLKEWVSAGVVKDFVSDTLLSTRSLQRGIYQPDALKAVTSDQGITERQVWGMLCLELWHQRFLDG